MDPKNRSYYSKLLFSTLLTLTFSLFQLQLTIQSRPEFPCNLSHDAFKTYPFCDTSLPISIRAQTLISLRKSSFSVITSLALTGWLFHHTSGGLNLFTALPRTGPESPSMGRSNQLPCSHKCLIQLLLLTGVYGLRWLPLLLLKVTLQDMEDTYQPPFKSCIEQGKASCLMCSYDSVNGVPASARGDLLQKARKDWGFDGYVTSDCDAVATISEYQFYVKTPEDAVAAALKAGVDINCGTYMLRNAASAIEQGKLREEDIDHALQNLLAVLFRLGLFDGDPSNGTFGRLGNLDICTKEHQRLALEAARQGIVLLKNDKMFLPLSKDDISSVAIIGPGANSSSQLLGGYSGVPCNEKSYVEGIKTYIKKTRYVGGCIDVACESNSTFDEALLAAESSDHVILIVGLDLAQETEDKDRVGLLPPGKQMDLVSSVAAVSRKPIILVLTGGGPLDVSFAEIDPRIASILWVGYPGEAGGKALAQVIFGDYNPGGRLPMTWYPESFTKIPMNDMNMRPDPSRLYPGRTHRFYTGRVVYGFGHGLSYTNYTYKLLSVPGNINLLRVMKSGARERKLSQTEVKFDYVATDELLPCDMLKFTVRISVMNVGDIDGCHVVMLYSRAAMAIEGAPRKQLVGFSRVQTTAHGSTETRIIVDPCEHLCLLISMENGFCLLESIS